jgi:hypothetical protein
LDHALRIVRETIDLSLSHDPASLTLSPTGKTVVPAGNWDSVLMNATINNNQYSLNPSNNTGVVYADYYFLQFGNRLLEMALA